MLDDVLSLYHERKKLLQPVHQAMLDFASVVNGDKDVPLPEIDEHEKVAVANLPLQGLEQLSMRVVSTTENVWFPPLREGIKTSRDKADKRRQAYQAWSQSNRMRLKDRKRSRWLVGYGMAPVQIRWNPRMNCPEWVPRSPLTTYPSPHDDGDTLTPLNCVFSYRKSYGWLKQNYPEGAMRVHKPRQVRDDDMFTLLEYVDADYVCLVVLGASQTRYDEPAFSGEQAVELTRLENRANVCPVVIPQRITLDRLQGQFDGMIGMFEQQAKLMALELIAVMKGVFPDTYVESDQGQVTDFQPADGMRGEIGRVVGGRIRTLVENPGYMTNQTIDRLERAQRLEGGVPSEFGGESTSNVRTGRRGDAILSATVDFRVQEYQEILAQAREEEIRRAIAFDKAYTSSPKSFYVSLQGKDTPVTYDPNEVFETDECRVSYSYAGADANGLIIGLGQRISLEEISMQTARELDPMVENAEQEKDRIISEGIMRALMSSIQTQAADPQGPYQPQDLARIAQLVVTNAKELPEAILQVQQEAQERQATPAEPMMPETMPGLALPGMGAEQPTIPEPTASVTNLAQTLSALRRPNMTLPAEEVA